MSRRPDFVIIGAMKCATSTLHDQLARQPGIFMSVPKEPNFFSNDERYARGIGWYESLFETAAPHDLCGESSTHYTKLPTYPLAAERLRAHLPDAKLVYSIRHPIDRLISHYIHEWTEGRVTASLERAVELHPELVHYGCYAKQLAAYLELFPREQILPVFFERLRDHPQEELERIAGFLGYPGRPEWVADLSRRNVSSERLRRSAVRDVLDLPLLRGLRRTIVPRRIRRRVRRLWTMRGRPELSAERRRELEAIFDEDLAILGNWLGASLCCENFARVGGSAPPRWSSSAKQGG